MEPYPVFTLWTQAAHLSSSGRLGYALRIIVNVIPSGVNIKLPTVAFNSLTVSIILPVEDLRYLKRGTRVKTLH